MAITLASVPRSASTSKLSLAASSKLERGGAGFALTGEAQHFAAGDPGAAFALNPHVHVDRNFG